MHLGMSPDAPAPALSEMRALTAIRFFAALWVVLYHFRDQLAFCIDDVTLVFANGPLGVDFFFVLSGFVMAHVYSESVRTGTFDYRNFLRKRFARLYPLHLVTLLALVLLAAAMSAAGISANNAAKYDWSQLPWHLLLIHAWGVTDQLSWNIPSWSISAEFAAYLLFPLLMAMQLRVGRGIGVAVAAIVLIAFWLATVAVTGSDLTRLQEWGVIRIIPEFFLGIALWRVRPGRQPLILIAAVIALLLLLHFGAPRFAAFVLLAALVWSASAFDAPRWLVYLGEASYSLYMIHAIVQTVAFNAIDRIMPSQNPAMSLALVGGVTLLCVLLSIASYEMIEKPARKWLTRGVKNRPAGPVLP